MGTLEKVIEWAKVYAMEEPQLKLLHKIKQEGFPNIGLACPSADDRFNAMYIYIPEDNAKNKLPKRINDTMEELAQQCNFVIACDNWETARNFIMVYLKKEETKGLDMNGLDPRLFPDEVSLN